MARISWWRRKTGGKDAVKKPVGGWFRPRQAFSMSHPLVRFIVRRSATSVIRQAAPAYSAAPGILAASSRTQCRPRDSGRSSRTQCRPQDFDRRSPNYDNPNSLAAFPPRTASCASPSNPLSRMALMTSPCPLQGLSVPNRMRSAPCFSTIRRN